jgi:hypothetical protein
MVFPNCGPLPQTSQTRAITRESFQAGCRKIILQESGGFRQLERWSVAGKWL